MSKLMGKGCLMLMKKTWVYGAATLVVLGALTTACGSKDEVHPSVQQARRMPRQRLQWLKVKTETAA